MPFTMSLVLSKMRGKLGQYGTGSFSLFGTGTGDSTT